MVVNQYKSSSAKNIIKWLLVYVSSAVFLCIAIMIVIYIDQLIRLDYMDFPVWPLPSVFSIIVVTIAAFIVKRHDDSDTTKSEFVSLVTHKFRTPMTHIKWASENMMNSSMSHDQKDQVGYIKSANEKLVELTDLLVTVSGTDNHDLVYRFEKMDLSLIIKETIDTVLHQVDSRSVEIKSDLTPDLTALVDTPRIRFVAQTFIENAIHFGGSNPLISITCKKVGNDINFSVTDIGIGIPVSELPNIFKKFYRGKHAKNADSEGMGIGLFMSKKIITKHSGKIGARSNGPNTGSTFFFTVPVAK